VNTAFYALAIMMSLSGVYVNNHSCIVIMTSLSTLSTAECNNDDISSLMTARNNTDTYSCASTAVYHVDDIVYTFSRVE